jgi:hypothetical protein
VFLVRLCIGADKVYNAIADEADGQGRRTFD